MDEKTKRIAEILRRKKILIQYDRRNGKYNIFQRGMGIDTIGIVEDGKVNLIYGSRNTGFPQVAREIEYLLGIERLLEENKIPYTRKTPVDLDVHPNDKLRDISLEEIRNYVSDEGERHLRDLENRIDDRLNREEDQE